ncbi:MAG: DUF4239 domain-containing protein [Cyanobacteria bacterium SZAS LIN-3]|nr:DUF4239 domain-containing protein [Cyanobacteria bacterium SZAS LIN-3]MBS2008771.1 DUF4239 domain-containing protein [Cyanobacteria bacterium SZAS TMP-1]
MVTIDSLPLWALFWGVFLISLAWAEGGYRLGHWRAKKGSTEPAAPLGTIVASILGLLAFMLAFTFNVAVTRFDDRRAAVLQEANDIGTTYLRAEFFDEPQKEQIKKLLREYVQLRSHGLTSSKTAQEVIAKSVAIQNQLWPIAAQLARENKTSPTTALFISSLNDVIDMHSKRVTLGLHARVPASVWIVLLAVSVLSMLSVGYYCGITGNRSWAETMIMIATFALVILLVADLDRPYEGLIKTNQQPMIDLNKQLGPP